MINSIQWLEMNAARRNAEAVIAAKASGENDIEETYVYGKMNFCGSKKHTMTDMFTNATKPFYESTSFCYLTKLPVIVYGAFIREKFESAGKSIDDDSLDYILEWTKVHTYYTQRLCNEVFWECKGKGV